MQYHVQMIPAAGSPELEEEFNRFLRSHRVIAVQKSLEVVEGSPCWCFCVEWLEGSPVGGGGKGRGTKKIDYKDVLSAADFAVFARLPFQRKQLHCPPESRSDGLPRRTSALRGRREMIDQLLVGNLDDPIVGDRVGFGGMIGLDSGDQVPQRWREQ